METILSRLDGSYFPAGCVAVLMFAIMCWPIWESCGLLPSMLWSCTAIFCFPFVV